MSDRWHSLQAFEHGKDGVGLTTLFASGDGADEFPSRTA